MSSGPSSSDFLRQPLPMELRVVERDGKRWLQQWRHPNGCVWEWGWVDVAEIAWPPSNVRPLHRR
jgi:hypothetical protein